MNVTYRFGDFGDSIEQLQRRLSRAGYAVEPTHLFDDATLGAVVTMQTALGLVADGIVGPKTLDALRTGQRDYKQLCHADLRSAATMLDVPLACVLAVNEVESCGSGFLPDGRPALRFERHVFWRRLVALGICPASIAADFPNILSQTPGGYHGQAAEYSRLACAERISAPAAREASSWGAFQVMGYHWSRLGYAGIDDFVTRMRASEADQMDAFVRYVAADSRLWDALKTRKWAAFAKGYNGPDYARRLYDVKLARAYSKYAERPVAAS